MPLGKGSIESLSLGQLGSLLLRDTTAKTGDWGIIEAMVDSTFTTLTSGNLADGKTPVFTVQPNITGFTLSRGQRLYGRFSAVTLATGAVMLYNL